MTGTRKEWLAARLELLREEQELTRRSDELARRRELPWVRVDKDYRFETDEGNASLADLFRGHPQLLVYHFMFGPDWTAGCPSCASIEVTVAALLEICGPLFTSNPVITNLQYRLKESGGVTIITFRHQSIGLVLEEYRNAKNGWAHLHERMRQRAEALRPH